MIPFPRIALISSMLFTSGLFAKEENACRKDYVFCPSCKVSATSTGTPDGTETPDDNGLGTVTPSASGTATATPTETDEGDATNTPSGSSTPGVTGTSASSAGNLFFEISKELNKKSSLTPVPPASLPTPLAKAPAVLGNWIGQIGEEQNDILDSDGDGYTDGLENRLSSDPEDARNIPGVSNTSLKNRVAGKDSDYDGLSDLEEAANGTNPQIRDSDGDGVVDGIEIMGGFMPSDKNDRPDGSSDTDSDGLVDRLEKEKTTNPKLSDTDGDTLSDADEVAIGADPFGKDTDGDGILDGREVKQGSDPMVSDFPEVTSP